MMKHVLLLIAILLTLSAKTQTKVYHPFPDSNVVWNIDSYQWCGGFGFDVWEHLYSIKISGDTIINSANYHKLQVPVEVIKSSGQCSVSGTWTIPGYYIGSIRQDISNKKVFFIPPTKTTEQLLYDFNMDVGDTVRGFTEPGKDDIVKSIDSVLVGTDYRKRWNINPCYGIFFIEGIGSTYGLIEQSPGCITDARTYAISCFHQNGQTLYPNTTTNCELITSINSIEKNISSINIFPNPNNGNFVLELSSTKKQLLQVFDVTGKLMFTEFIQNGKTTIDAGNLAQGVYNLCISDNEQKINKRLVIVR